MSMHVRSLTMEELTETAHGLASENELVAANCMMRAIESKLS